MNERSNMNDNTKLINALREKAPLNPHEGLLLMAASALEALTAENEPLTCRDCEYAAYEWSESNKNTDTCHCKKWKRGMKQTDFCSYAERKPERSEGE